MPLNFSCCIRSPQTQEAIRILEAGVRGAVERKTRSRNLFGGDWFTDGDELDSDGDDRVLPVLVLFLPDSV
jgi:hypothetical protein